MGQNGVRGRGGGGDPEEEDVQEKEAMEEADYLTIQSAATALKRSRKVETRKEVGTGTEKS